MEPAIKKAEQKIEYLTSDEEAMKIYWERERSLHERANMITSTEMKTARNFIKAGATFDMVLEATGLSEDKVKKLFDEASKEK